MILGGEDEEDGVSCWQANLTSRHIAGCVNKGGMVSREGLEVPTPALRVPYHHHSIQSPHLLGTPWASWFQFRGVCVRGWDMSLSLPLSLSLRLLPRAEPHQQQ